jgi:tetracycline resistance efflux pump
MQHAQWLSVLPPLITIALAIISKRIIPSLFAGILAGSFLLSRQFVGTFETSLNYIVQTLSDKKNLQVLLFLYLFSGVIYLIKRSGGIKAFSQVIEKRIASKKGVFYTIWALIPFTFIDCGFRVMATGSITKGIAEKHGVEKERLAFTLNNTASPLVELIPVSTTFVGFNISIIQQGLNASGNATAGSAYSLLLNSIPLQFFSIVVLVVTFLSIFLHFNNNKKGKDDKGTHADKGNEKEAGMHMDMKEKEPEITPRLLNLIIPFCLVIGLSIFFFWYYGQQKAAGGNVMDIISKTDPNMAMLTALLLTLLATSIMYALQHYPLKNLSNDLITGGNQIMHTLAILALAWPLAMITQDLGLGQFIKEQISNSIPVWSIPALIFIITAAVTYFMGASWGASAMIMPFAVPLAAMAGVSIPLIIAAVISGASFGDVTSPVSGMTNMASNIAGADHKSYIKYAAKFNFLSAGIAAVLFIVATFVL